MEPYTVLFRGYSMCGNQESLLEVIGIELMAPYPKEVL